MAIATERKIVMAVTLLLASSVAVSQIGTGTAQPRPWMAPQLSPAERAELVLGQLTLHEKISLLHGEGMAYSSDMSSAISAQQHLSNGGAGFVLGIERLGIPTIQMSDAAYGVRGSAINGRYSTALPSNLALAASWDTDAACEYGSLIGKELRMQGYNASLGGGINLTRDPRNGRTFEYSGEDPILAGTIVGHRILCEGKEHVISDIKHFAMNDQESGRDRVDVTIDERSMRESDLFAFQIGVKIGEPKAVMCSYNGINHTYACESHYLLTEVLKNEWRFRGFVMSDWGGTHSTARASSAGLDQEQPLDEFYGEKLEAAVTSGQVPMAELDDHVRRVLWAEFASGIVDYPPRKGVVDVEAGFKTSAHIEELGAVLLRNREQLLPLDSTKVGSISVIGLHADTGMISGGGSAQVDPPGSQTGQKWRAEVWFPTSPLDAIKIQAPKARVNFVSGENIAEAVDQAKAADVAIIFATQWEAEDGDLADLSLPNGQDKLIAAVAAANPRTIVVLETGTAVTMPWLDHTGAVLEAWYGGSKGADAIAKLLFGIVNPSGKLPMTFPISESDLPRSTIAQPPPGNGDGTLKFGVNYSEGLKVGYKWYESEHKPVLFPFGFGLSYTSFRYSNLKVDVNGTTVKFTVTNAGKLRGTETAEIYASLPVSADEPPKRLIGWQRVSLAPGESRSLSVDIDPLYLSLWSVGEKTWVRPVGTYEVLVGTSSADLSLRTKITLR